MIKCCFCAHEYEEVDTICAPCLSWLEAFCVPGPDGTVTGHDRENALSLVNSLQDRKAITDKAFDLIRKCISRGAERNQCNCMGCSPQNHQSK